MDHGGAQDANLPQWVPAGALHYIAHTENGAPIRALAREAGCHASTILRQIRRIEMRRDDPLVDAVLRKLGAARGSKNSARVRKRNLPASRVAKELQIPTDESLAQEAMRVLRRLCETGAVLAVAEGLDKAVVVRDGADGQSTRTAVVSASVAQAMALKDWIAPSQTGRITRYQITASGRTALAELMDRLGFVADRAAGLSEDPAPFGIEPEGSADPADLPPAARARYALAESPLSALARRRDKDGKRFLDDALVQSGERLREDFELAQMDGAMNQGWDAFLEGETETAVAPVAPKSGAPAAARARVKSALADLGPGLSDVVLRCCCYLEGLETTEKRLGWSARSGKIVLRIALMRLKRHYDETIGPEGAMIG